ncbi:MAG: hypothetical protein WCG51_06245, partial [Elusimicrobiota bacterium]
MAAMVIWSWLAGVGELLAFGAGFKPMAPGTAILLILTGSALYFYYRDPKSLAVIRLSYASATLLVVASGLVCWRHYYGWNSPVEQWLATGADRIGNYPVGQISLACGALLLTAGLAFLLRLTEHPSLRWISTGLALVVLLAGVGVVVSYAIGLKWITSLTLNRVSLTGGVAFILLGLALLGEGTTKRMRTGFLPIMITAGLTLAVGVTGAFGLRYLQKKERVEIYRLMKSISDLKVEEIVNWRQNRWSDAHWLAESPTIGRELEQVIADPES